jgi:hypothetical protein
MEQSALADFSFEPWNLFQGGVWFIANKLVRNIS